MHYRWARAGDVNAFFGLMLDNVAVMVLLFSLIASDRPAEQQAAEGQVHFTPGFVVTRMLPGTALGVLLGDLVYTLMAFRLARRTGRDEVTAMPLGLDTPSTFGIPFLVLLPAINEGYERYGKDLDRAMDFAWHVGLVVLVLVGVFKVVLAPLGNAVRRLVPRAGLLGSLAAIALALIAFLPLAENIAALPLVGMTALAVILWTLVAHRPLPGRLPGALAAVLLGVIVYRVGLALGAMPAPTPGGSPQVWRPGALLELYGAGGDWWIAVVEYALKKLPVVLPFALATIVGGIDCTESAAAAGDEYDTGAILMTEGVAALVAGLLGGVLQTTPYIGHPAYKKMGGRAAYTLATGLFVGGVGFLGGFDLLFEWLPPAAMFPILVFVGLEITAQSFRATPARHYPALAFAVMPALAYLVLIPLKPVLPLVDPTKLPPTTVGLVQTLRCLSGGFIVTSLLWAAALAMLIDGRLVRGAGYFALAGVCALFGIIHSPLPDEQINLPVAVLDAVPKAFREAVRYQTPYHWAGAYALVAALLLVLALWHRSGREAAEGIDTPAQPGPPHPRPPSPEAGPREERIVREGGGSRGRRS
jgi:AGZA family xanthine/uracil permease-like MFS transporter